MEIRSLLYQFIRLPYRLLEVPLIVFYKQGTNKDVRYPLYLHLNPQSLFPSSFSSIYQFTAIILYLTHSILNDCCS